MHAGNTADPPLSLHTTSAGATKQPPATNTNPVKLPFPLFVIHALSLQNKKLVHARATAEPEASDLEPCWRIRPHTHETPKIGRPLPRPYIGSPCVPNERLNSARRKKITTVSERGKKRNKPTPPSAWVSSARCIAAPLVSPPPFYEKKFDNESINTLHTTFAWKVFQPCGESAASP